jgi:hypothetical protein
MKIIFYLGGISMLRVATVYDLYRTIGNINIYAESKLLKVKVLIVFLGTVGFSLCREGRYLVFFTYKNCHPPLILLAKAFA